MSHFPHPKAMLTIRPSSLSADAVALRLSDNPYHAYHGFYRSSPWLQQSVPLELSFGRLREAAESLDDFHYKKHEAIRIDQFAHEKTLISQGLTQKNQGLGAMRALGLEPRPQGLKVHGAPNESVDETTTPQQIPQQLELSVSKNTSSTDEKTTCLTVAIDSVRNSKLAVEKLLDSIARDDQHSLGILGPILSGLRDAEREIAEFNLPAGCLG